MFSCAIITHELFFSVNLSHSSIFTSEEEMTRVFVAPTFFDRCFWCHMSFFVIFRRWQMFLKIACFVALCKPLVLIWGYVCVWFGLKKHFYFLNKLNFVLCFQVSVVDPCPFFPSARQSRIESITIYLKVLSHRYQIRLGSKTVDLINSRYPSVITAPPPSACYNVEQTPMRQNWTNGYFYSGFLIFTLTRSFMRIHALIRGKNRKGLYAFTCSHQGYKQKGTVCVYMLSSRV